MYDKNVRIVLFLYEIMICISKVPAHKTYQDIQRKTLLVIYVSICYVYHEL